MKKRSSLLSGKRRLLSIVAGKCDDQVLKKGQRRRFEKLGLHLNYYSRPHIGLSEKAREAVLKS